MKLFLTLVLFMLLLGVIARVSKLREYLSKEIEKEQDKHENQEPLPIKKKLIFTKTEYTFWKRLKVFCDERNILICPKVRMEDFVQIDEKDYKKKQHYRGQIKSRHVDFLLCDSNMYVLAGIELDDISHNSKRAEKADMLKNRIFETIKVPLFRIAVTNNYDKQIVDILSVLINTNDKEI